MMPAEWRWGGLHPDMAITYSAKSDNESKESGSLTERRGSLALYLGLFFRIITRLAVKNEIPSFEVEAIFLFLP